MNNHLQDQLKNWVFTKRALHVQNEAFFRGTEKGYPLYLAFDEVSTPFYLYTTNKDGGHAVYYGVDEGVIELTFTPHDFGDEKRMMLQLMEKRAQQMNKKIQ